MKRALFFFFFLAGFLPLATTAQTAPTIHLSAIKVGGDSAYDEFVLVHNSGDAPVDLSGFTLQKQTSSGSTYTLATIGSEQLSADGYYLFAQEKGAFAGQGDETYTQALAANNTLSLLSPGGDMIDQYSWQDYDAADVFVRSDGVWHQVPFLSLDELEATTVQETQPSLPLVTLSEYALQVAEGDVPWIELHSQEAERIDLAGWMIEDDQGHAQALDEVISPGQDLVIPLAFSAGSSLALTDKAGSVVSSVTLLPQMAGTSIIQTDEGSLVTDLPTPGRPNILVQTMPEQSPAADNPAPTSSSQPQIETGPLVLNELFANPAGDETTQEFIELWNPSDQPVQLYGWQLSDKSKTFTLPEELIDPHGYAVLTRAQTGIALNNTNESVTLTDPFGSVIDRYSYETTTEGLSENRGDVWYEGTPTPGAQNTPAPQPVEPPAPDPQTEPVAETPTPDPAPVETPPTKPTDSPEPATETAPPTILLNELLPNPAGSDSTEWIELSNPTDVEASLDGCILSDGTTDFDLSGLTIPAQGYLVVPREQSKIALNNDGDVLSLYFGNDLLDAFEYETSHEDLSWSRFANDWQETAPTPGQENVAAEIASPVAPSVQVAATTKVKKGPESVALSDWEALDDGANVQLSGVITVVPGLFGKRSAFIQSPDSGIGIELYFSKGSWPPVEEGDLIQATGEKSITKNGSRLLVRSVDDIAVIDNEPINPVEITSADQMADSPDGTLVSLSGMLVGQTKSDLQLSISDQQITVDLSAAHVTIAPLQENSSVQVVGLFSRTADGISVKPRTSEDIIGAPQIAVPPLDPAAAASTPEQQPPDTTTSKELFPFLSLGAGSILLIGSKRQFLLDALKPLLKFLPKKYE